MIIAELEFDRLVYFNIPTQPMGDGSDGPRPTFQPVTWRTHGAPTQVVDFC